MKQKLDQSRFKKMIFEIGCFMDLYNSIMSQEETSGTILSRFVCYFNYLNFNQTKNDYLLSMIHPINGDNLLNVAKQSRQDGIGLYNTLLKFVESNEVINDKLQEYGYYFNERRNTLHNKMGQVCFFFFFLFGFCCYFFFFFFFIFFF